MSIASYHYRVPRLFFFSTSHFPDILDVGPYTFWYSSRRAANSRVYLELTRGIVPAAAIVLAGACRYY